jgi:isocitrate lyase
MSDFIEIISIGDKRYSFSFRENESDAGYKFYIVTLEGDHSISFEMKEHEKSGAWKINSSAPDWIKKIEDKLREAITIRQKLRI